MLCRELIEKLEELAPKSLACEWDNSGFLVGRGEKEITKVLVALDATDRVVEQAVREKADFLLTHHPLLFRAIKQVTDADFISRRIVTLLQADISYFAMHTNFDAAPGCMADLAAKRLQIQNGEPLEATGEVNGIFVGIGKAGILPESCSLEQLAETVKEVFGLPFALVYGSDTANKQVSRVAVSPGAGGSMIRYALEKHAEVLITGDIGHHDAIDAAAQGLAIIDAGHYGLEHIFIPFMAEYIRQVSDGTIEVIQAEPDFSAKVI